MSSFVESASFMQGKCMKCKLKTNKGGANIAKQVSLLTPEQLKKAAARRTLGLAKEGWHANKIS